MNPNPAIMQSVEALNYRVTVGDVALKSGLDVQIAQQELLNLASSANGHLQVADTGDIVYLFPQDFRNVLRNKYWRLRLKSWLEKIWNVIFYLLRISFGIILIASIILVLIAIVVIVIGMSSNRDDNDNRSINNSRGGGMMFFPRFWFTPDFFYIFSPNYHRRNNRFQQLENQQENELNFLESIYSFLFGDGNPNQNLEERRWREIASVIQSAKGAVIAEQIAPYLDNITIYNERDEDYMLPVLTRFNGYPEVSEEGEIIYYFPELQVTAKQTRNINIIPYLKENFWRFTIATSQQKIMAVALGGINFVLLLVLGSLLSSEVVAELGSFIYFVSSIYGILVTYAIGYLAIPLIRYFWLQSRNKKIEKRNQNRQEMANFLQENKQQLLPKLNYAQKFAQQKVINQEDITYSTERNLLDQVMESWENQ
ncbi:MAG: hypothetical protein IGQ45_00825 [Cyanobacterium sp. T60_A2020_053]|nr:hypothetical protein [Cyanobacterium sp. T60_A2020_053]